MIIGCCYGKEIYGDSSGMKDMNLFETKDSICLKKIKTKADIGKDDCDGYLIEGSEKEARKIIASLKDKKVKKLIGFIGGDDAFNRRAVESLKIDYLVSPERGDKKDGLKQRDSGINHVVAKMAKDKRIVIVVDLNEVSKLKGKEKALRIERIIQNMKICRKAGCGIKIANLASSERGLVDEKGRIAIGVSFGMSSVQARDSVKF